MLLKQFFYFIASLSSAITISEQEMINYEPSAQLLTRILIKRSANKTVTLTPVNMNLYYHCQQNKKVKTTCKNKLIEPANNYTNILY